VNGSPLQKDAGALKDFLEAPRWICDRTGITGNSGMPGSRQTSGRWAPLAGTCLAASTESVADPLRVADIQEVQGQSARGGKPRDLNVTAIITNRWRPVSVAIPGPPPAPSRGQAPFKSTPHTSRSNLSELVTSPAFHMHRLPATISDLRLEKRAPAAALTGACSYLPSSSSLSNGHDLQGMRRSVASYPIYRLSFR
jgi:hypothetical protein